MSTETKPTDEQAEDTQAVETVEDDGASQVEAGESEYSKLEAAHYDAIRMQNREVRRLGKEKDDTKTAASFAKKAWERASTDLQDMIEEGPNSQPLLPGMDGGAEEPWRTVNITELISHGLTEKDIEKLNENDPSIKTLGDVASFTTEYSLTDVSGFGPTSADRYSDAFNAWWEAHPDFYGAEVTEDEDAEPLATTEE